MDLQILSCHSQPTPCRKNYARKDDPTDKPLNTLETRRVDKLPTNYHVYLAYAVLHMSTSFKWSAYINVLLHRPNSK